MRKRERGLTLVELLITVAVVAVVAALAGPDLRAFVVRQSVNATAQALVEDFRFARSEAIKRSRPVAICSSNETQTACATQGWRNGWIVFVPTKTPSAWTDTDTILKTQARNSMVESIAPATGSTINLFSYESTGLGTAINQTFLVTPVAPVPEGSLRVVCISSQGRASLRNKGATQC